MRIIDARHHLWDLEANSSPWLKPETRRSAGDLSPICKSYRLADVLGDARSQELAESVQLQAEIDQECGIVRSRGRRSPLVIQRCFAAAVAALIGLLAVACAAPLPRPSLPPVSATAMPASTTPIVPITAPMLDPKRGVLTLAPVIARVTGSVVNIATSSHVQVPSNPLFEDPFFRRFFNLQNEPREREVMSAGSGVVVDAASGYVLTNHHLIDNADQIRVALQDGRELDAKLVGSDPDTDLAVLKIDASGLTALPFGNSDDLEVGDLVIAIGNPFDIGQTVTSGIVSALGRRGLGIEGYEDFIQTDASINPGNSGGALINSKGELIGVNTAIIGPAGGNVGIGFAVPSNIARSIMRQLIEHGEVRHGRLGVSIQDLTPEIAQALGLRHTQGAVISQVEPGSPAAQAGLEPGDVIVEVNGRGVEDSSDLRNQVRLAQVGSKLDLTFYRNGQKRATSVGVVQFKEGALSSEGGARQLAALPIGMTDHPALPRPSKAATSCASPALHSWA
jgi:Do/DeqQ family serine protease